MEKECRGCLQLLSLASFYKHKRMADGHLNYCKTCVKNRVSAHRKENIEKINAYDKWRYRAKLYRRQQLAAWFASRTPEQRRAHDAVSNAVRDGRLVRPNACSKCGKKCKPEGHHDDYSRPLDVRWLCRSCHCLHHAQVKQVT